jgi:hypothetical protein
MRGGKSKTCRAPDGYFQASSLEFCLWAASLFGAIENAN